MKKTVKWEDIYWKFMEWYELKISRGEDFGVTSRSNADMLLEYLEKNYKNPIKL